jgi:hypothetical protein
MGGPLLVGSAVCKGHRDYKSKDQAPWQSMAEKLIK